MASRPTVLVTSIVNPLLEKHFRVINLQSLLYNEESPDDVEGIVFNDLHSTKLPEIHTHLLPRMSRLKVVMTGGIGVDPLDHLMEEFHQRSIIVAVNSSHKMSLAVADFAIGLMLSCGRAIHSGAGYFLKTQATKMEEWLPYWKELLASTHAITGRCIGVIGMGRIGYEIAKKAYHGFNMKVLYFGRKQKSEDLEQSVNAEYCPNLEKMLPMCDFVVVSCGSNTQSRKILGAAEFSLMKSECIVINVARGDIIDTEALVGALKRKEIAGAGLDVTHPEPLPPGHPLLTMDNVIITPHAAWCLQEVMQELEQVKCQNLVDVLIDGKMPAAYVPPLRGTQPS